jgi:alpha-amylase/alpha-mannosidase (GH57 family)
LTSPRYVCIHGHFYQPPRENPWTEVLERQPSAAPAHDWNERVLLECYWPNARARLLHPDGAEFTSNYSRMSFNFGPTLLRWMETARPHAYAAILEADRESRARFGRGSAMAQTYHHAILPLSDSRDRRTEIRWGLADFAHRFGRPAEGMWLAETAVDVETLDLMAAEGVAFTVLAPHQCAEVQDPDGLWHDMSDERVDPRRPYRIELPSGRSIVAFFYDGSISRGVAFEGLLDDGQRFADRLAGVLEEDADEPQIAHIATDGESYGHHHRFGEMALASALLLLEEAEDVELINYAAFLERHPPTWGARIVERSSWSCAHGVGRWCRDCGCKAGPGPSQQRWRGALRETFDELRDAVALPIERAVQETFRTARDPLRDAYIEVVLDSGRTDAFLDAHLIPGAPRSRALRLLELERHLLMMYTSCGWFFDDVAGLEATQVLRYAARAVELATDLFGDRFEPALIQGLAMAEANHPSLSDGAAVYRELVTPHRFGLQRVAAHLAVRAAIGEADAGGVLHLGVYEGQLDAVRRSRTGRLSLASGQLHLRHTVTLEDGAYAFAVLHLGDHDLVGGVRRDVAPLELDGLEQAFARADSAAALAALERAFPEGTFSLADLYQDERARLLERLLGARTRATQDQLAALYEQTAPLLRFARNLQVDPPPVFAAAAEVTLTQRLRKEVTNGARVARIETLLDEAAKAHVHVDQDLLARGLEDALVRQLRNLDPRDEASLRSAVSLARFLGAAPFRVEAVEIQHATWELWQSQPLAMRERLRELVQAVGLRPGRGRA